MKYVSWLIRETYGAGGDRIALIVKINMIVERVFNYYNFRFSSSLIQTSQVQGVNTSLEVLNDGIETYGLDSLIDIYEESEENYVYNQN